MQQFTLSTPEGRHLGFIVFLPDNEHETPPQSGVCMLRLQAAEAALPEAAPLPAWADQTLFWRTEGEALAIYDAGNQAVADLRQQYLRWSGRLFVLSDLSGNL